MAQPAWFFVSGDFSNAVSPLNAVVAPDGKKESGKKKSKIFRKDCKVRSFVVSGFIYNIFSHTFGKRLFTWNFFYKY